MKILLVTYSCQPWAGSEDGAGWHMLRMLSQHHQVVVVTRKTYQQDLERERLPEKGHDIRFVFVRNPVSKQSLVNRKLFQPLYYQWQLRAARTVRQITSEEQFDIVQHVTWCRCWMPSAISGAVSGKLVWGPVGGVETIPDPFLDDWEYGPTRERFKKVLVAAARFDPQVRKLARKADLGLATTSQSQNFMTQLGCRTELLSGVALDSTEVDRLSKLRSSPRRGLRFISIGRLLGWKGFHYGIRAFCRANIPDSQYWIVGDGPATGQLRQLVAQLGLEDKIRFWGAVERARALELLSESHVLVHPSFRDSGGWVCLESMAARKPVICLDLGGPAVQVNDQTGTIVPASHPEQVVTDLAAAMGRYADDDDLIASQGDAGLARVQQQFTWESRYPVLLSHYESLLAGER